jgi:hypothetical protein
MLAIAFPYDLLFGLASGERFLELSLEMAKNQPTSEVQTLQARILKLLVQVEDVVLRLYNRMTRVPQSERLLGPAVKWSDAAS